MRYLFSKKPAGIFSHFSRVSSWVHWYSNAADTIFYITLIFLPPPPLSNFIVTMYPTDRVIYSSKSLHLSALNANDAILFLQNFPSSYSILPSKIRVIVIRITGRNGKLRGLTYTDEMIRGTPFYVYGDVISSLACFFFSRPQWYTKRFRSKLHEGWQNFVARSPGELPRRRHKRTSYDGPSSAVPEEGLR